MPFNASERDGFVLVRNVSAISDSLALICELVDGRRVGIPTHAIAAWSDVRKPRDYGTLAVKRDVAESMRLWGEARSSGHYPDAGAARHGGRDVAGTRRAPVVVAPATPIQVQNYLAGMDYPVGKDELLEQEKRNGADEQLCRLLEQLPDDEDLEATSTVAKR